MVQADFLKGWGVIKNYRAGQKSLLPTRQFTIKFLASTGEKDLPGIPGDARNPGHISRKEFSTRFPEPETLSRKIQFPTGW